jgi:prevent-host-death family protein
MPTTTLTSREFNQDTSRAKKAARRGPVVITDRGKPAHVLMTFQHYERLTGRRRSIVETLSMPGLSEIELEVPRSRALARPAAFE